MMRNDLWILLLLICILSCTGKPTSSGVQKQAWKTEIEELKAMQENRNGQEVIVKAKQKIGRLLRQVSENDSTQAEYATRLVTVLIHEYINAKQIQEGLAYLDSLSSVPFLKKYCPHDLYASRAHLNQLIGNNAEAIQLADTYIQLPECKDVTRFIMNAETISGVYVYCSNDIRKAIQVLEEAVQKYREGGKYPHIMRLISRLGIYYRLVGEYEKATVVNQEAILAYNDSLSPQEVVIAYGEQANLYAELGMYEQALQNNAMAIHHSLRKDSFGLGDVYRYRAEIFLKTGDKDSVFHYLRLGERVSKKIGSFRGVLVNNIELLKAYLNYPDSLDNAIELGWTLCRDTARIPMWAKYQFELYFGQSFLKVGEMDKAVPLIKRASQGFASIGMIDMEYEANNLLLEYFRKQKATDDFMYYYDRNRLFADSLKMDEKLRAIAGANIRFGAKLKENENEQLSIRVKAQQQQLFYNIYISITLFIILSCSIAYIVWKRRINRLLIERSRQEIQRLIFNQQKLNRHNEQLAEQIEQITAANNLTTVRQLVCQSLLSKEDETAFRQSFATIYPFYLPKLRKYYPQLTRNEELLAMLICMGQSTDEIALVMGINRSSVNIIRSRMRKNMGLSKEESLDETVKQYLL